MSGSLLMLETGLIICWSSGFIGAQLASSTPSVFLVLFWRFLLTAVVLVPFTYKICIALPKRDLVLQLVIGALAMFASLGFGVKAIDLGVPLGTAALITALQPLVTAALAGYFLKEKVRLLQWLGLVVGLLGVAYAVSGALGAASLLAYAFSFLGMLSIVAASLMTKYQDSSLPIVPTLGLQSGISALLFLPLALYDGSILPVIDSSFILAIVWFILLSTIGGYGFYWLCLHRTTATRVASLMYFTPAVTAVWGLLMFGQPITMHIIIGFAVCLVGVWLASTTRLAFKA
ncbi:MAG: DMT family transporter [Proteobacteria bacterium]|nr:DMT family transporter [Pseudomonadota bacterium]